VNKVLSKKGKETSEHVATLEEGFQRLQQTFRTTVLDSLDADAHLNDRIRSLEAIVDSLTASHGDGDGVEFDALGRPASKINTFPRGHQTPGSSGDIVNISARRETFSGPLKNPDKTLRYSVGRKAKHRKRGEVAGKGKGMPRPNNSVRKK